MKQKWMKYSSFFMLFFFTMTNVYAAGECESGKCISCGNDTLDLPVATANIMHNAYVLIKIVTPLLLVVMGMFDFGRAVLGSNEEDIKKKQNKFINRVIAAVMVFLVISIVEFGISILTNSGVFDASGCLNKIIKG